jgi:hypothetical protein
MIPLPGFVPVVAGAKPEYRILRTNARGETRSFTTTRTALASNVMPPRRGRATIEFRPFDDEEMNRKGAAALALEQIY